MVDIFCLVMVISVLPMLVYKVLEWVLVRSETGDCLGGRGWEYKIFIYRKGTVISGGSLCVAFLVWLLIGSVNWAGYLLEGKFEECREKNVIGELVSVSPGAIRSVAAMKIHAESGEYISFSINPDATRNLLLTPESVERFVGKEVTVYWQKDYPRFGGIISRKYDSFKYACEIKIQGEIVDVSDIRGSYYNFILVVYAVPVFIMGLAIAMLALFLARSKSN